MKPGARELDDLNQKLVRQVILQVTRKRRKWGFYWNRSLLLEEGFGPLVVRKAEQYDLRRGGLGGQWSPLLYPLYLLPASFLPPRYLWLGIPFVLAIMIFSWAKSAWFDRRIEFTPEEDQAFLDEITAKLGPAFVDTIDYPTDPPTPLQRWLEARMKRPLLWRVDRFLGGKAAR